MNNIKLRARITALFLAAAAALPVLDSHSGLNFLSGAVEYDNLYCGISEGSNINAQNYDSWAKPTVGSYLTVCPDGKLMRVQHIKDGAFGIEYYDSSFGLLGYKEMRSELALFIGFYAAGDGNYYILSGKENPYENDGTEVYRLTKYDSEWNELSHASLYGENTTVPWTTADFTDNGQYIAVRTAHTMYRSDDGLNHQANMTFQVNMETMEVTDKFTGTGSLKRGYVSHSFDQYITADEDHLLAVDLGDAYPRGIPLVWYRKNFSGGTFTDEYDAVCSINAYEIPPTTGTYQKTGVSVGGFAVTDETCIIPVSSVSLDPYDNEGTRNISVITVGKELSIPDPASGTEEMRFTEPTVNRITDFAEGEKGAGTPQFVQTGDGTFLLLWTYDGKVYYTAIDKYGNNGEIYSMEGALSDCRPVMLNGDVVWFTYEDFMTTFYRIHFGETPVGSSVEKHTGHDHQVLSVDNGTASVRCAKCGDAFTVTVPTALNVFSKTGSDTGSYRSVRSILTDFSDTVKVLYKSTPEDAEDSRVKVGIEDTGLLKYDAKTQTFTPLTAGRTNVTFSLKYNPDVAVQMEIIVDSEDAYTLTCPDEVTVTRGTARLADGSKMMKGDRIVINAEIPEGQILSGLYVNGEKTEDGSAVTVTGDTEIRAYFVTEQSLTEVSGKVTAKGSDDETPASVEIIDSDGNTVSAGETENGNYSFEKVPSGRYTLRVSKTGYAPREYDITVGETPATADAVIVPMGDSDGSGSVEPVDATQILRYEVGLTNCFTDDESAAVDDYLISAANVLKDDDLNARDATQILRAKAGLPSVFDVVL